MTPIEGVRWLSFMLEATGELMSLVEVGPRAGETCWFCLTLRDPAERHPDGMPWPGCRVPELMASMKGEGA